MSDPIAEALGEFADFLEESIEKLACEVADYARAKGCTDEEVFAHYFEFRMDASPMARAEYLQAEKTLRNGTIH
jgi:hypothetical protein